MREKRVWRYWCEYCNKAGLQKGAMATHEKHCTANPQRACRMHAYCPNPQVPVPELIACLDTYAEDHGIEALRQAASGCPACMLAAIRQSKIYNWDGTEDAPLESKFDMKDEFRKFWDEVNNREAERDWRRQF